MRMASKQKWNHQRFVGNQHQLVNLAFHILLITILGLFTHTSSSAQRIGKQAEMDRLEQQADDLAAQADLEGAALAIGKAAMMAELLRTDTQEPVTKRMLQATSHLFRAQEQILQALALFERAGGMPPASGGVCHYLAQGNQKVQQSKDLLENISGTAQKKIVTRRKFLLQKTQEWDNLAQGLHQDLACHHEE